MLIGSVANTIAERLAQTNDEAGFAMSLVCDASGLLLASAGDSADQDNLAALTSLFEDIVYRSRRDLGIPAVDEVSMVDPEWGRLVIRPLPIQIDSQLFLVVRLGHRQTWRRYTNRLKRELEALFDGGES